MIFGMEDIKVIYKDDNFLAVYKPAGVLVHEVRSKKHEAGNDLSSKFRAPCLVDWLLKNYPEVKGIGDDPENRPGIVHRLDRDTSGIILIPRNQEYFEYLKGLFQKGEIKKTYLALVWGKVEPKTGVIEKPIALKSGTTKRTIYQGKMRKEAITEYKVLKSFKIEEERTSHYFTLLEAYPKTGRTHQIRIHLSSIGYPVVGDSLYGPKKNPFGLTRQFLHAESLEFTTKDGKRLRIGSDLPEELSRIIKP